MPHSMPLSCVNLVWRQPFAGDVFRDVSLLFPGLADQKNLARVYDRLHRAIREVGTRAYL